MSAVPADLQRISSEWRRALLSLALLILGVLLLYRETALAMETIWARSGTFAHCYLVPPIVLWLVWRQRDELRPLQPRPQPWFVAPLAAAALVWLLGDLVTVNAVTQLSLVAMIVASVPAVLGWRVTRALLFPLAFLFFCVPLGEFLLPTMMNATADFTVLALRWSGIPVYREGLQFVIPSGNWSVVEACSGIRYLIASFMVGTLFGYLNYRSNRRRLVFAGVSLVVPIVANWVRAYLIVMVGHLSDNRLATGVDHLIYGWLFFGLVIGVMFYIGSRWSEAEADGRGLEAAASKASAAVPAARSTLVVATLALLVVMLPPLALQRLNLQTADAGRPVLTLPQSLDSGWAAAAAPGPNWKPRFENPSLEATQWYAADGRQVKLHVAYYRGQNYGRKLVSSENVIVTSDNHDWNQVVSGEHKLAVDGRELSIRSANLLGAERPGQAVRSKLTVWQLYWVNDTLTASDYRAKVEGVLGRLAGGGDDGAAILMAAEGDAEQQAKPALEAFARANLGRVVTLLQQARAAR